MLTNAHTHLELSWLWETCPPVTGEDFVTWMIRVVGRRLDLGDEWPDVFEAAVEDGILELLSAGTTHVADVTATGKSIAPLFNSGLEGVVYVEILGLNPERADEHLNRARAIIDVWRPRQPDEMQVGLSIHAPYSAHPALWEKALDYARREALPLCIHIAESPAERDFLLYGRGAFADEYYEELNIQRPPVPLVSPVRYLDNLGALDLKPLLIHAVQVDADDIARIAASGSSVVHCPRSELRLGSGRFPLAAYLDAEVPVYLGTESRASSPSLNVLHDLDVAAALHYETVPPEALEALARRPLFSEA